LKFVGKTDSVGGPALEQSSPQLMSSRIGFPVPTGCSAPPVWTGSGFLIDEKPCSILSYEIGSVGWNNELTEVHEEVAGDDHYIDRASREHAAAQLRRGLERPDARIMDIGCSSGFFLRLLRERFPGCDIVGADCVRGPLERLSESLPDVPLLQFDLLKCPWADESFDALTLLNVLEHVEDDLSAMRQVYRILKPGGIAVIEVPAGPDLYDVYDRQLLHYRRYRMVDLLKLLEAAGFEVVERSHLGFFLFPAFWMVKKRNRKYLTASPDVQRAVVRRSISSHSSSAIMHAIMRWESKLREFLYYPFGIRCLVTCRRPAWKSA
jgi:ubiquinone/menaquinone biosynthesis C-methylase UbiE